MQLFAYTANLPASLIGLEACAGAHFVGAVHREQGHQVRLIPASLWSCTGIDLARPVDRPHRPMVGREGRLESSARICTAGRRPRGFVGARLFAPQGGRSGPMQRIAALILVLRHYLSVKFSTFMVKPVHSLVFRRIYQEPESSEPNRDLHVGR